MSRPAEAPRQGQVVHGCAVARGDRALLILGASGAGKSGLALRLVALGAELVADDRVVLRRAGRALLAAAPPQLAGLIEARGLGLLQLPVRAEAALGWAVDLDASPAARMPQPATITFLGVDLPLISGAGLPNIDAVLTILLNNGRAHDE